MALLDEDVILIASGQPLSTVLNLGDKTICGFHMPAAWDAAAMTFQISSDGGATFSEYWDSKVGSGSVTVLAGQYIALDPNMFRGVNCIKFRSGTSGVPVNQTSNRNITVASKRVF